jgi:hypothetical protein
MTFMDSLPWINGTRSFLTDEQEGKLQICIDADFYLNERRLKVKAKLSLRLIN